MVKSCFKDVRFKEFSRKLSFHESLKSVTRKIEECFEGVSIVFHRSLKGISRMFQSWFSQVIRALQECFKEVKGRFKFFNDVSWLLQGSSNIFCVFFKVVWIIFMSVSWMFQGFFKRVLKKLQRYLRSSFKVLERKLQKCSKVVSWKL